MKKKRSKKLTNKLEEELLNDAEQAVDFLEHSLISPPKLLGLILLLFAVFSFFALFGMAGNFGATYFLFATGELGVFAYFMSFLFLLFSYTFSFQKTYIFKTLNFWLFAVLFLMAFITFGFFSMSGALGDSLTMTLRNSFGLIPTLFLVLVISTLSVLRIFETDLVELIRYLASSNNTTEEEYETKVDVEVKTSTGIFGALSSIFNFGKAPEKETISVNHLEDFPQATNDADEYEEIEVEEEIEPQEDYRSAMYKAVSVEVDKPEKETVKVKKLVKKTIVQPSDNPTVAKENQEVLRQVNEKYSRPPISLYTEDSGKASAGDNKENSRIIKRTLADFGISVEMDEVTVGPTVTRYALKPAQGVKIEKIMNLSNNIALELGVASVSITRVHERSLIGIEVPNKQKASLGIGTLLCRKDFLERKDRLTMVLGKDIYGEPVFADMTKMPHLLIAGTTGSGKSSLIHGLVNSLIYKNSPYDLKFILIDPKKVEFALYNNLPHLYTPVIKDPKKAVQTLNWLVQEMDRRYAILEECGKQNISAYHQFVMDKYRKIESKGSSEKLPERMPYIVLIIDELADFMMKYPKEMESGIVKLAQMSRAVGIHLILATQRPSTNIITGVIKGNIPSRVALRVASQVDSRVIIDQGGAEKLLGYGDLLFVNADGSEMKRIQSPFVSEEEIKDVVAYLRAEYDDVIAEELKTSDGNIVGAQNLSSGIGAAVSDTDFANEDDKYEQAKEIVLQTGKTSVSNIQVRLGTGYARSAKLINMLEQAGVIITVTDNSGKKVKAVHSRLGNDVEQGRDDNQQDTQSNTREDILKIEENPGMSDLETAQDTQPKEKQNSFFRF